MQKGLLLGAAAVALLLGSTTANGNRPDLDQLQAQLPGTLINDPATLNWTAYGPGTQTTVRKGGEVPGGAALEVTIPAKGATVYANGINVPVTGPIRQGQDVVVSFRARTVSADTADSQGTAAVRFQQNAAPYAGFGDTTLAISKDWKLFEVTARASRDFKAGEAVVGLQLSGARQTLQIAQVIVQSGATSLVKPVAPAACKAATPALMPQLAGKGELLTEIDALNWDVSGPVRSERIAACGIAGDSALRFSVDKAGANPWDAVASVPITGALAEGDPLLVAIVARAGPSLPPSGTARLGLRLQVNAPPYDGFAENVVDLGPNWKLIQLRTTARKAIPAGQGVVALHLAALAQVLDIGRVYVIRLAPAAN